MRGTHLGPFLFFLFFSPPLPLFQAEDKDKPGFALEGDQRKTGEGDCCCVESGTRVAERVRQSWVYKNRLEARAHLDAQLTVWGGGGVPRARAQRRGSARVRVGCR